MDLKKGNYYNLYNIQTQEKSLVYYYYNQDAKETGFGFNIADGGGFLSEKDLNENTKITKCYIEEIPNYTICTTRHIVSAFAYNIIKQSPYKQVDNLLEILEDIRLHLVELGYVDENIVNDKYDSKLYLSKTHDEMYKILESIRDNVQSFRKLNITKKELDNGIEDCDDPNRKVKYIFTSMNSYTKRDVDFIDLDACIRNVLNLL